jgi:antirestriction protein ArdC
MTPIPGGGAARRVTPHNKSGNTSRNTSHDTAADINARIIAALERGVLPWKQPWTSAAGGHAALPLRANGAPYRGANVVILWMRAAERGYVARRWYSFRQALSLGAHVRRGETGARVVYYGTAAPGDVANKDAAPEAPPTDDATRKTARFLRSYVVFNAEQIDGLPASDQAPAALDDAALPLAEHEAWFASLDITRIEHPDRAFYSPARDVIAMPPHAAFHSADLYAQTLNHECVHATAAAHRVGRDFMGRYGPDAYAVEEICAELGAAYLGAHLGLPPGHIHDHSAYIGHWITVLKNDRRVFLEAAAKAQIAVDWLLDKSGRAKRATTDAGGDDVVVGGSP